VGRLNPIAPRAETATENAGERRYALRWTPPAGAGAVTYTVESSSDGKAWFTVGIGLKDPSLTVSEAQARSPFIRVIATDGFRESAPAMVMTVMCWRIRAKARSGETPRPARRRRLRHRSRRTCRQHEKANYSRASDISGPLVMLVFASASRS
jgi:hypothetical protein